jgi:agmatine deiminase
MWKIPPETYPHSRTWTAWPWNGEIWNNIPGTSLESCQLAIDRLVRAILNYENVALLARKSDARELERRFKPSCTARHRVEIVALDYNDIWVRDTFPAFAIDGFGSLVAINWNFNGWGRRVAPYGGYGDDAQLCKKVAALTGARLVDSRITAEGGAFAFGRDDLTVATKSVMFDKCRNPSATKAEVEQAIVTATGREHICWIPGDRQEPITSGHADSFIAFAKKRNVLVNWIYDETSAEFDVCDYNLRVFQEWSNQASQKFEVIRLPASTNATGYNHCSSYVNFAHVNGGLIIPEYGDGDSDKRAQAIIAEAFENSLDIEAIDISAIASAGGSIHCVTQQQPATGHAFLKQNHSIDR